MNVVFLGNFGTALDKLCAHTHTHLHVDTVHASGRTLAQQSHGVL